MERADIGNALARGEGGFEDIRRIADREKKLLETLSRSEAELKIISGVVVDMDRYGRVDLIGDLFGLAIGTGATIAAMPGVAAAGASGGPAGAATAISVAGKSVMTAFSLASTLGKIVPTYRYEHGRMAFDLARRQMEGLTPEQRKTMKPDYTAIDRVATTYAAINMALDTGTSLFLTKYSDSILEMMGVATVKPQFRAFLLQNSKNAIVMEAGEALGKALTGQAVGNAIGILKEYAKSEAASNLNKEFEKHLNRQQQK